MKIPMHADSQISLEEMERLRLDALFTRGFLLEHRLVRGVAVDTQEMLGLWSLGYPEVLLWRVAIVGVLDGLPHGFEAYYREESDARAAWDHIAAEGRKTGVISPGTERDAADGYLDRAYFMTFPFPTDSQVSLHEANRLNEAALFTPGFVLEHHLVCGAAVGTQEFLGLWSTTTPEGMLWQVAIVGMLDGITREFEVHYREESDARAVWDHLLAEGRATGLIRPAVPRGSSIRPEDTP